MADPKSKDSLRSLIERGLAGATVASFGLVAVSTPSIYRAILTEYDDPNATVEWHRADGSAASRLLRPDFERVQQNHDMVNLFVLRGVLGNLVVAVGDELKRIGLNDPSRPEHEFLRHIRNAVAHGNRFSFKEGEPRRKAAFGKFVITPDLAGQGDVLFDFLGPGDATDLLVHIHDTT